MIRYDVRGIGKSTRPQKAFSHSQDLYALLKFLKINRAHFIGLSVGGAIAIDFTLEHPEMVDHLILAASGVSDDAKAGATLQGLTTLTTLTKTAGIERVIKLTLDTPFVISKDNAIARERIRRIYRDNHDVFESGFPLYLLWQPAQPPASARLSEIHAQTLVVRGDNDNPAYITLTDKISQGIKGARVFIISPAELTSSIWKGRKSLTVRCWGSSAPTPLARKALLINVSKTCLKPSAKANATKQIPGT